MGRAQRFDHLAAARRREHGLEAELRHAFLDSHLADRGLGAGQRQEGSRSLGVPRAAVVVADPARARRELRWPPPAPAPAANTASRTRSSALAGTKTTSLRSIVSEAR